MSNEILVITILCSALVVSMPLSVIIACKQVTGSIFNAWHFFSNYKYWCFAILNYRYRLSKIDNKALSTFLNEFMTFYLNSLSTSRRRFSQSNRDYMYQILACPQFVQEYLGLDVYPYDYHLKVLTEWELILNDIANIDIEELETKIDQDLSE